MEALFFPRLTFFIHFWADDANNCLVCRLLVLIQGIPLLIWNNLDQEIQAPGSQFIIVRVFEDFREEEEVRKRKNINTYICGPYFVICSVVVFGTPFLLSVLLMIAYDVL